MWHKACNLELKDGGNGLWSTRVTESSTGPVRGITMSDILKDFQINRVGLLKVDVEGAEHEIFSDAQQWIEHVDARFASSCTIVFAKAARMSLTLRHRCFPTAVAQGRNWTASRFRSATINNSDRLNSISLILSWHATVVVVMS